MEATAQNSVGATWQSRCVESIYITGRCVAIALCWVYASIYVKGLVARRRGAAFHCTLREGLGEKLHRKGGNCQTICAIAPGLLRDLRDLGNDPSPHDQDKRAKRTDQDPLIGGNRFVQLVACRS